MGIASALEHALDPRGYRLWFVDDLAPGDSCNSVTRSGQHLISPSIMLKCCTGAVGFLAVRFDGQSLVLPQQIDLDGLTIDFQFHVAPRPWDFTLDKHRQQTGLKDASHSWQIVAPDTPWGNDRAQSGHASSPLRLSHRKIERPNIEQPQNCGLLYRPPQLIPAQYSSKVYKRP
ncbi:MAG TPA: hypothetical protein VFM94_08455 [Solirubrobacterales bacterium]|nr:hypothetical protein [Solirubrobacterales bacterium]